MSISPATQAFIAAHRTDNVRELALHTKRDGDVDVRVALEQIAGWQIARTKLPSWAATDGIIYPPHLAMEQCSSEATARYKASLARRLITNLPAPHTLLDLTGGFGVDCSYLAREFDAAVYVERRGDLCSIAQQNFTTLGLGRIEVTNADAEIALKSHNATLIYLDPARRDEHGARTYAIEDCTPNVLAMANDLLTHAPVVMVKLSPMLDWRRVIEQFKGEVSEVHVVATGNECKELLLILTRESTDDVRLVAVNDEVMIECHASETTAVPPIVQDVRAGMTLCEPNASIMKLGCFATVSERYSVSAIAPHSHLFVAEHATDDFPGRVVVIDDVFTMTEAKRALKGLKQANIAVRNFPLTVAELRKKFKLTDGGDTYLFATTDASGAHLILRTHKVA